MQRFWIRNLFTRPGTRTLRKPHRARLALQQLEERLTPSVSFSITPFNPTGLVQPAGGNGAPFVIQYNGGPLLTHVHVQGVYYNDPTTLGLQSQFDGFFKDILRSPWLTQMLANYSVPNYTIGAGSFLGDDNTGVTVPEGSILDIGMIYNQLTSEVANHKLAVPDDNTLYSVFVPAGVEVPGVAVRSGVAIAYHVSDFDGTTRKAVFPPFSSYPTRAPPPTVAQVLTGPITASMTASTLAGLP